jgi:hypothetical protein
MLSDLVMRRSGWRLVRLEYSRRLVKDRWPTVLTAMLNIPESKRRGTVR